MNINFIKAKLKLLQEEELIKHSGGMQHTFFIPSFKRFSKHGYEKIYLFFGTQAHESQSLEYCYNRGNFISHYSVDIKVDRPADEIWTVKMYCKKEGISIEYFKKKEGLRLWEKYSQKMSSEKETAKPLA